MRLGWESFGKCSTKLLAALNRVAESCYITGPLNNDRPCNITWMLSTVCVYVWCLQVSVLTLLLLILRCKGLSSN